MYLSPSRKRWILWIAAGVLLRLILIAFPRPSDDDTGVYLELGHNLLRHGIYGIADGNDLTPSLFRLPGYPLFLATIELSFAQILPNAWLNVVYVVQAAADLAGGLLLAAFARRFLSRRAAEVALALAMLCPFTAAYAGIAMTECLSVFAVSLGIYAAGRALAAAQASRRDLWALALAGFAAALAMLLRPDGALLFAALAAGLFGYTARSRATGHLGWRELSWRELSWRELRWGMASAALFCLVALTPLAPWTWRNWTRFHVFEPLAPRHVNDPGERVNLGFYRWLRTWSVDFASTGNVFWAVGQENIDIDDLPPRAFDSPRQREQTRLLLDEYNRWNAISPQLDDRFAALAAERIRSHPLRYYLVVPLLRVADMFLRPRTEAFYLDIYWWRWSEHPAETLAAVFLGLINLGYVGLAAWAFLRGRVPWPWMLGGYLLLRCLVLATLENPEPRYTLECFPILIVAAAAALAGRPKAAPEPL
ncbi:MAG: glycosyltransferase family 39 protein [Terracidiphilus sp.]|jgi:hypothetical protein